MTNIIVKIMVELISILAIAKNLIGRGRLSERPFYNSIACDYH